jgi:hypothetical protein
MVWRLISLQRKGVHCDGKVSPLLPNLLYGLIDIFAAWIVLLGEVGKGTGASMVLNDVLHEVIK